jgi:hypothetical protein
MFTCANCDDAIIEEFTDGCGEVVDVLFIGCYNDIDVDEPRTNCKNWKSKDDLPF